MYAFEVEKIKHHYKITVRKNRRFKKIVLLFIHGNSFFHPVSGDYIECDSYEEALSQIKNCFDPFQDAIDRINRQIDNRISNARNSLHLRIAGFRGVLFSHGLDLSKSIFKPL